MIKIHKTPKCVKILNKQIYEKQGLIGTKFHTSNYGTFVVTKATDKRTIDRHTIYEIVFDKTNSVYYVTKKAILNGEIKDFMSPTVSGVGFLGKDYLTIRDNDPVLCKALRVRWKSIIGRNYNKNMNTYCNYGGKGVTVDPLWFNFCNFYNDIIAMKDFDREKFISGNIEVDKDIKQYDLPLNKRVYSKDTVTLIDHKDNMKYVDYSGSAEKQSRYFIVINKFNEEYLYKNITEFSKNNNILKTNISKLLNKKLLDRSAGGYRYRYPTEEEYNKIESGELKIGDKVN